MASTKMARPVKRCDVIKTRISVIAQCACCTVLSRTFVAAAMESNVAPVEKKGPDELPPSYSGLGHEQSPPPSSYYPPSQPPQYSNTQQPQPMMYPNLQHPQVMVPPTQVKWVAQHKKLPASLRLRLQVVIVGHVNDYMGLSLVTLLCCCCPIGICALMSSMRVRHDLVFVQEDRISFYLFPMVSLLHRFEML